MIRLFLVLGALCCTTLPGLACGPIFPTMYAVRDLAGTVLSMPRGSFSYELYQLTGVPRPRQGLQGTPLLEREAEELCLALNGNETDAVEAYQRMRAARSRPDAEELHAIPDEFLLYAEGAFHFHQQQWSDALASWQKLLDLPPGRRQYRSSWAAYMCGEVYLKLLLQSVEKWTGPAAPAAEAAAAIAWYRRTRELTREGFADSLDLTWSSLGQEARVAFLTEDYLAALHGYLEQYRTPTTQPTHHVEQSLRWTAARMLNQPAKQLLSYAADPMAASVLTSYLLSRRENASHRTSWMLAVAETGNTAPHASRLAWLAYNDGEVDMAQRLLVNVKQPDPMTRWLQAKIALWNGDTDRAIGLLESLAERGGETPGWPGTGLCGAWWPADYERPFIDGELGLLYLARKEYDTALDRFLRGGLWNDAAYVAEQVMTTAELETYLTRAKNADQRLAHLLARRWMRAGERDRALAWYPEEYQTDAQTLDRRLREAADAARGPEEQAAAMVKAARIIRSQGMELLGSELDPDWSTFGGSFDYGVAGEARRRRGEQPVSMPPGQQVKPTADELHRVAAFDVANPRRFHYRKVASDMMWEAAQELPDNDMRTAEALYYGGVYLKNKYPSEADRFYKALVNRCRKLPIGQEADRLRWFPPDVAFFD